MTALNWWLDENIVLISADSLALDTDGQPYSFCTKLFPVPHLQGVVCGTGLMPLILDWFVFLESQVIAQNMAYVDTIATAELSRLAAPYQGRYEGTSTIYHFGLNPHTAQMEGYAYRSAEDFRSERLQAGLGMKPPNEKLPKTWAETAATAGIIAAFIEVIKEQKRQDALLESSKRVGVGGEVHLLQLTKHSQTMWTCYRFEDYSQGLATMLQRLQTENSKDKNIGSGETT